MRIPKIQSNNINTSFCADKSLKKKFLSQNDIKRIAEENKLDLRITKDKSPYLPQIDFYTVHATKKIENSKISVHGKSLAIVSESYTQEKVFAKLYKALLKAIKNLEENIREKTREKPNFLKNLKK